jgi:hypothetical protein
MHSELIKAVPAVVYAILLGGKTVKKHSNKKISDNLLTAA